MAEIVRTTAAAPAYAAPGTRLGQAPAAIRKAPRPRCARPTSATFNEPAVSSLSRATARGFFVLVADRPFRVDALSLRVFLAGFLTVAFRAAAVFDAADFVVTRFFFVGFLTATFTAVPFFAATDFAGAGSRDRRSCLGRGSLPDRRAGRSRLLASRSGLRRPGSSAASSVRRHDRHRSRPAAPDNAENARSGHQARFLASTPAHLDHRAVHRRHQPNPGPGVGGDFHPIANDCHLVLLRETGRV